MQMGFDKSFELGGAGPAAPDYRTLLAVLSTRSAVHPLPAAPVADGRESAQCSFSRAGFAKLLGLVASEHHGKDCLNLGGSSFGESGGLGRSQPGDRARSDEQGVQGSYA
jgi:hypothetical protein